MYYELSNISFFIACFFFPLFFMVFIADFLIGNLSVQSEN